MSQYKPKTKPLSHQARVHRESRDRPAHGLLWEMGCGKTKAVIDVFGHLVTEGEVDALFVLAPKAVYPQWVLDEVPKHLPDELLERCTLFRYQVAKHRTKKHQRAMNESVEADLLVASMSYSAYRTKHGEDYARRLLKGRRCLFVLDEATRIKTPKAKITRRVLAGSVYAPYRRLLTGTPITNNAFDAYTLMRFLDNKCWRQLGLSTVTAFRNYFGVYEDSWGNGRQFRKLVGHKNLDQLQRVVKLYCDRVLKEDVLDLPPKSYQKVYFDLTPEQRRDYDSLRRDALLMLEESEVDAPLFITRMLRMQQVTCGYVPAVRYEPGPDGLEREVREVHRYEKNPRLDALLELLEDVDHQAIIWARFREDIDQVCAALGDAAVRFDGQVGDQARLDAVARFQYGDARWFVGNPAAAGEGLTLHAARTVVYYSNSPKLGDRLQSEDRAHRIGQEHPVQYYDIIGVDTIDEHWVQNLRNKKDIAAAVTGDQLREWI